MPVPPKPLPLVPAAPELPTPEAPEFPEPPPVPLPVPPPPLPVLAPADESGSSPMMLFEQAPRRTTERGHASARWPDNQGRGDWPEDAVITEFFSAPAVCPPGARRRPFLKIHSTKNCHQILCGCRAFFVYPTRAHTAIHSALTDSNAVARSLD